MADRRRQAFQRNPELQRFVLSEVQPTGKQLGTGSYGSVKEVEVNGVACAGKRLHDALVEQGNAGVANIVRKYLQECQVKFCSFIPRVNFPADGVGECQCLCQLDATTGDGRVAAPTHRAVPGAVFPRRVGTSSAGDGTTGQQLR